MNFDLRSIIFLAIAAFIVFGFVKGLFKLVIVVAVIGLLLYVLRFVL